MTSAGCSRNTSARIVGFRRLAMGVRKSVFVTEDVPGKIKNKLFHSPNKEASAEAVVGSVTAPNSTVVVPAVVVC